MKKAITIRSENAEIMTLARVLQLKDSFLFLGFKTRRAFVVSVADYLPKYNTINGLSKLERWWALRLTDENVNSDVELVLNKLKNE